MRLGQAPTFQLYQFLPKDELGRDSLHIVGASPSIDALHKAAKDAGIEHYLIVISSCVFERAPGAAPALPPMSPLLRGSDTPQ